MKDFLRRCRNTFSLLLQVRKEASLTTIIFSYQNMVFCSSTEAKAWRDKINCFFLLKTFVLDSLKSYLSSTFVRLKFICLSHEAWICLSWYSSLPNLLPLLREEKEEAYHLKRHIFAYSSHCDSPCSLFFENNLRDASPIVFKSIFIHSCEGNIDMTTGLEWDER